MEDVAEIILGQSPPSSTYNENGIGPPFLQGKAEFGPIYPSPVKYCSDPKRMAPSRSVLISVRAPVGDVNIAASDYAIGRGLASLDPSGISEKFLFYYLTAAKSAIEARGTGSTFKSINKSTLKNFPVPLPPKAAEQTISRILWQVDKKLDAESARRAALDQLFQRLLHDLMRGAIRSPETQGTEEGSRFPHITSSPLGPDDTV